MNRFVRLSWVMCNNVLCAEEGGGVFLMSNFSLLMIVTPVPSILPKSVVVNKKVRVFFLLLLSNAPVRLSR